MNLCLQPLNSRSIYNNLVVRRCYLPSGHEGRCHEFPYLFELNELAPRVANKIKRDATKTTGAAWASDAAGPNRIDRWVMLENDSVLLKYGINMLGLSISVQNKLREKAATYEDCMEVAAKLTWSAYQMQNSPACSIPLKNYLEARFGRMHMNSTCCIVCRLPLNFHLFDNAVRGRAEIETAHKSPRQHNANNVGFAHRECNIAQGNKTLDEFYTWIYGILSRI